ncbi:double-stranded RNA-specific editase B2-like isoform X2 [Sphaeramia orbicularis]|uniref:double-stranded RNA-specific editase B2-like isoform X2 n=1 Tax=Sphaeramia orbicularis TaxID=375764 RepID=UPI00117F1D7E|nr:double-stranded RNA-specific editase B2 isoform X2 [Sphaeramia orbicularis]
MSAVNGSSSRSMDRSDGETTGKSKRKRRRRSKGKGRSSVLSTLISPARHWETGASSAEEADTSSTSSLEANENQDDKNPVDCDLLKYHPSAFCIRRETRALKRKQPLVDGKDRLPYQSHLTCKRAAWAVSQKNALVQLNELRPGLQYEILSKTGPLHAPLFSVAVEVNGLRFEGSGPTKKQAKMRAAELALRSFIQFPNASQVHAAIGNFTSTAVDFTADQLENTDAVLKDSEPSLHENCDPLHCSTAKQEVFSSIYKHRRLIRLSLDFVSSANPIRRALSASLLEHFSPVALLNELRPGLRYICLTERVYGRPPRSFIMVVKVEGRVFEGCGHSKRLAKAQAAAAALQSLFNINLGPERMVMGRQGCRSKYQLPQFFTESIFHLVRQKHSELTDSCFSTSHACHKVLAGIVMTRGFDLRSAQVVSLATGTKCLDAESVSDRGLTLSDCHAEVVSRRALVRFLYAQLELLLCKPADGEEQSIFVPNKSCSGFRLRDDILFHMYISSSPCGDARLNCPYETKATYPGRRFRCHLRVKVDGGEGTLPVTARRASQKWNGVLPGKPLITLSCTDKITKWSVVGLQGALLSHLVEPVYLHSLTVGTLSHTGHLSRAIARRLALVRHLPFPYRRQQLLLGCLSRSDIRPSGKAPNSSVNWSFGDEGLEEISTSSGRRKDSGTPSRLCRSVMFARWQRLQQQISGKESTTTYYGSKMAAGRYQRALQQFTGSLQGGGLGTWIRKHPDPGHGGLGTWIRKHPDPGHGGLGTWIRKHPDPGHGGLGTWIRKHPDPGHGGPC